MEALAALLPWHERAGRERWFVACALIVNLHPAGGALLDEHRYRLLFIKLD